MPSPSAHPHPSDTGADPSIAKDVAARHGLLPRNSASFDEVLRALKLRSVLPREVARQRSPRSSQDRADCGDLVPPELWRAPDFKPGPFVPPASPIDATAALVKELEELRARVRASADNEAKVILSYQEAEAARLKAMDEAQAQQREREF
jgi:type I restriction enzyme R subunit